MKHLFHKHFSIRVVLIISCAILLFQLFKPPITFALAGDLPRDESCGFGTAETRAVVKVIDSETLVLDDGREVRLIGALGPKPPLTAVIESSWAPERAAQQALESLVLGKSVEIAVSGRRYDRYGRLLAHVFVTRSGERRWVQGEMLKYGHARAYGLPENFACMRELLAFEALARAPAVGLWTNAAYQTRQAYRTRELMRLRNTFQIVQGRVSAVTEIRGRTYLNFGNNWRNDFSLGVSRSIVRAHASWGTGLNALKGKNIRVRGFIERRNGPYVEILHPSHIEVLPESDAQETAQPSVGLRHPDFETPERKRRPVKSIPGAVDL